MADEKLKRDVNHRTVIAAVTDDADKDITQVRVDSITKELLVKNNADDYHVEDGDTLSTTSPEGSVIAGAIRNQANDEKKAKYIGAMGDGSLKITDITDRQLQEQILLRLEIICQNTKSLGKNNLEVGDLEKQILKL